MKQKRLKCVKHNIYHILLTNIKKFKELYTLFFNCVHEDLILLTSSFDEKISRTLYITDFNNYNILDKFLNYF
jgi:hypothetical protein